MKKNPKSRLLLVSLALLLLVSVGGTIAFLTAQSGPLTNTFDGSQVLCEVVPVENTPHTYQVKNTGDISAYIRVAVVATWQDTAGNIYYKSPTISEIKGTDWGQSGEYWYFKKPVAKLGEAASVTAALAVTVDQNDQPEGYELVVEVLAQAIQAEGKSGEARPVTIAWGVDVNDDGTLEITP